MELSRSYCVLSSGHGPYTWTERLRTLMEHALGQRIEDVSKIPRNSAVLVNLVRELQDYNLSTNLEIVKYRPLRGRRRIIVQSPDGTECLAEDHAIWDGERWSRARKRAVGFLA